MIDNRLRDELIEQVRYEFGASLHYLAASVWFGTHGLDRWAAFMREQADEERGHAMRIIDFLVDCDVAVPMPALDAVPIDFTSAIDIVKRSAEAEAEVTGRFKMMAKIAHDAGDFVGFRFLQWFLEEQVEEEALMGKLMQLLESGLNVFQTELLLPEREEEEAEGGE
jgi:ferritin